jgi:long-chain acyl-CoA synthetase
LNVNFSPERLETIFAQSRHLSNTFIYGESTRSYIVAVVIPDCNFAKNWAKLNGVNYNADAVRDPDVPKEICDHPKFKEAIMADFKTIAEQAKLNAYEIPTKVYVDGHFWTPDSGLVTDAMKNKRDPLYEKYKDKIEALYSQ